MPKSELEKAQIRQQNEARRLSDKDRSAHEAAREAKIPKLADLSREYPTEDEILNFQALIGKETDRGAAVMASALVELALTVCIRARLADAGESVTQTWFEGVTAPFGTFAAKIKLGRALGIYGPETDARLSLIKDVRNAFAHSSRPLNFDHPALSKCKETLPPENADAKDMPMRAVFSASCLALAKILIQNANKQVGRTITVDFP